MLKNLSKPLFLSCSVFKTPLWVGGCGCDVCDKLCYNNCIVAIVIGMMLLLVYVVRLSGVSWSLLLAALSALAVQVLRVVVDSNVNS